MLGIGAYLAGPVLLQIYSTDPEVIRYGVERMLLEMCIRDRATEAMPTAEAMAFKSPSWEGETPTCCRSIF